MIEALRGVRLIAEFAPLRDCLFLVKNGVPYDVAMGLDAEERTAYVIILSELDGGKFNWSTGSWEKPDA